MLKPALIATLLLAAAHSHALQTTDLPASQMIDLGSQLASVAGASQWQQLWQRARYSGYLTPKAGQAHFTLQQNQLPALALQTLAEADQATSIRQTQTLYRKNFSPTTLGDLDGRSLHALCLLVDWRILPDHRLHNPHAHLRLIDLVTAYPCD